MTLSFCECGAFEFTGKDIAINTLLMLAKRYIYISMIRQI